MTTPNLNDSIKFISSSLPSNDLSYSEYVSKNPDLLFLCEPQPIDLTKADEAFKFHDIRCEFILLKYLTEDQKHQSNLVKLTSTNTKLNRFQNRIPYEYNAVSVSKEKSKNPQNYINASFITGAQNTPFICAQNPMENTLTSFWLMIINHKISLDVLLSYSFEEGIDKYIPYWPAEMDKSLIINDTEHKIKYEIKQSQESTSVIDKYFLFRYFKIYKDGEEIHSLTQLHFNGWEDHSIPISQMRSSMIDVLINQILEDKKNGTILVHCSDGVGRTGTLLALFNVITCLMAQKKESVSSPVYNIFNIVRKLREERIGMVSDTSQYQFIYDVVKKWVHDFYH